MSEQAKPVGASDKMKAKDFITLGIFTVLFFAVVMVCIYHGPDCLPHYLAQPEPSKETV